MMKERVVLDHNLESMSSQFTHERDTEDKVPIQTQNVYISSIAEVFYNAKLLPRNPLEEGLPTQDE
eukprot:5328700-Ditylum_brightwellii.AAC.1